MRPFTLLTLAMLLASCSGEGLVNDPSDPTADELQPVYSGDPANNALYGVDISVWEGPMSEYEMDCFWANGVRHIVAGTQVEEVTRQQLEMARRRGMSLDAYVYLYWDKDMATQVRTAFQRVSGYRIGRMWLDVEQAPPSGMGASALADKVQQAVDACRAQTEAGCGIYSARWFWTSSMGATTRFADLPLWYALYNGATSLSSWSTEHFGGWTFPAGKQWGGGLCGVGGADLDTIQRLIGPDNVVDHTTPPAPTAIPAAPVGLFPASGQQWTESYLRMMVDTIAGATTYEFTLQSWNGSKWALYAVWDQAKPLMKVSPAWSNWIYRFQVRAKNAYGWGPQSSWSELEYGTYGGKFPSDWGQPPGADAGVSAPDAGAPSPDAGSIAPDAGTPIAPDAGAPSSDAGSADAGSGLTPDDNQGFSAGAAVTLSCPPVSGTTSYDFAIEYVVSGNWQSYFTYSATTHSKTFWPQASTSYRWRVAEVVNGVTGPWSSYATFVVH